MLQPLGLLQPIDAPAQLVELPLPGQAQILEQLVAIALQLPFGFLLQAGGFTAQGPQYVIHQGLGMAGIEPAAMHPFLAHVVESIGHQSGGAQPPQEQHLQQVGGIHRDGATGG